jgi:uncharacterized protein (TIGR02246 family)
MDKAQANEIEALYRALIEAWNTQSADGMANLFAEGGSQVGFDGSAVSGREEIRGHLAPIFASHPTPRFVSLVREVRALGADAALLRAAVGMIPQGLTDINPMLNAIQSMVAVRIDGQWRIELFQNTPAAFHSRPDEVAALTAELRAAAKA